MEINIWKRLEWIFSHLLEDDESNPIKDESNTSDTLFLLSIFLFLFLFEYLIYLNIINWINNSFNFAFHVFFVVVWFHRFETKLIIRFDYRRHRIKYKIDSFVVAAKVFFITLRRPKWKKFQFIIILIYLKINKNRTQKTL